MRIFFATVVWSFPHHFSQLNFLSLIRFELGKILETNKVIERNHYEIDINSQEVIKF